MALSGVQVADVLTAVSSIGIGTFHVASISVVAAIIFGPALFGLNIRVWAVESAQRTSFPEEPWARPCSTRVSGFADIQRLGATAGIGVVNDQPALAWIPGFKTPMLVKMASILGFVAPANTGVYPFPRLTSVMVIACRLVELPRSMSGVSGPTVLSAKLMFFMVQSLLNAFPFKFTFNRGPATFSKIIFSTVYMSAPPAHAQPGELSTRIPFSLKKVPSSETTAVRPPNGPWFCEDRICSCSD